MGEVESQLITGEDGRSRCWWPGRHEDYLHYHDIEWGRPVGEDRRLFEKLCLEGFQAGLSWLTILRKRKAFREAFAGFDPERVAAFGAPDVERLVLNPAIVRHRGKIEAAIHNAGRALELIESHGSLAAYLWEYEPAPNPGEPLRTTCEEATVLSRDLKRRGWKFVGPTTVYAFMQSIGMVNDHLEGCVFREEVERERRAFTRPC